MSLVGSVEVSNDSVRVLVVDDDFMVADVHRRLIEREPGFSVIGVAHSASEALAIAQRDLPDLVLLDIYLPDRSGLDVLRALRVSGATCEVVTVSAARDAQTIHSLIKLGGAHHLIKPFDSEVLRTLLQHLRSRIVETRNHDGSQLLSQAQVDRAFAEVRPPLSTLPKGLSPATRLAVSDALVGVDTEGLSASDVAALTGVSRVSARRYLEHLVEIGEVELSMRYGAAGRPEHRYRLRQTKN